MLGIIIDSISTFMYSKLLVILLIGAGIYFTIRTKLPQMRLFKDACKAVVEKPEDENGVSSFQALMVSTASRVGTGNIIGVSSAICIGGFGSVFWMWVIAIIGSASALIESTLAQIYKKKGKDGECYGGPAYYIEAALHCRTLAIIFCISMIATYAFGFNMLASYNLQSTFSGFSFYDVKWTPWIIGGILAVITGWCLLGGGSRIVKVTSTLVPAMGVAYILISVIVMIINRAYLPVVFSKIISEAFDFQAIFGAFAGSAMMQGIRRGLYSNEAGIGSAPNASASAQVSHPIKQGLVQMFSVKENICMVSMDKVIEGGVIRNSKVKEYAGEYVKKLRIATPGIDTEVQYLSGGNQQKVVIAKWLMEDCDVIILDEPTRGIDVGAKSEIYGLMTELVKKGKGVIMISSEMPEIIGMCDNVIIMHERRMAGMLEREELSQQKIMSYCT